MGLGNYLELVRQAQRKQRAFIIFLQNFVIRAGEVTSFNPNFRTGAPAV